MADTVLHRLERLQQCARLAIDLEMKNVQTQSYVYLVAHDLFVTSHCAEEDQVRYVRRRSI